jgi:hypothetical protein
LVGQSPGLSQREDAPLLLPRYDYATTSTAPAPSSRMHSPAGLLSPVCWCWWWLPGEGGTARNYRSPL